MISQSLIEVNTSSAGRLLAAGSFLLRRLCTAAAVGGETAVAPPEDAASSGPSATEPASSAGIRRLRRRLLALGSTGGKVADVLHRYIRDGHRVGKIGLVSCLRELRKNKRYQHCLEIFEWMDKGKYKYSDKEYALRIDIICKTKGIAEAEKYFESLTPEAKNLYTYGALLNCCCTEKLVDKANALFEEMDKLNYLTGLAFNNMMTLALTTDEPGKVPGLVEEMNRRNLALSSYAYSLLIQSYQRLNDMEGVERTIVEIEKDGESCHWSIYSNLAAVYIRAGDFEKAEMALKRLEELCECVPLPYHYLISFYATLGNLDAVNRVWDSLKSGFQIISNLSYLVMLQSLLKLGQMDQLQKCFEEWKSGYKNFDLRIVSVAIASYLRQNKVEEAEQVFNDAVKKSGKPFLRGREMFIAHFLGKREINSALRHFKGAIDVVKENDRWHPEEEKISAFWKYFEEEKDVDGAEEFSKLMRKVNCLDSKAYLSLLGTYVAAGKTASDMRERMEQDGIGITGDLEILLEKVCSE